MIICVYNICISTFNKMDIHIYMYLIFIAQNVIVSDEFSLSKEVNNK